MRVDLPIRTQPAPAARALALLGFVRLEAHGSSICQNEPRKASQFSCVGLRGSGFRRNGSLS